MPPELKELTSDQRKWIINAVLDVAEVGASLTVTDIDDKLIVFLRGNVAVIDQLIDWLFSNSGQTVQFAPDSPVLLAVRQAGLDEDQFMRALPKLQAAVAAAKQNVKAEDAAEFAEVAALASDNESVKDVVESALVGEDGKLNTKAAIMEDPAKGSAPVRALETRGFSFADLLKYLPVILQILQALGKGTG